MKATHGFDTETGTRYEIASKTEIDLTVLSESQLATLYAILPAHGNLTEAHRAIFKRLEHLIGKFEAGELIARISA